MVGLAGLSWQMFNGSPQITITAGSSVQEVTPHLVNGFSTLACITRNAVGNFGVPEGVTIEARWLPEPEAGSRSSYEVVAAYPGTTITAQGAIPTEAAYVRGTAWNRSAEDVTITVDFMLRA